MNKRMIVLLALLLGLMAGAAQAATVNIPSAPQPADWKNVKDAIDAAAAGDTVTINPTDAESTITLANNAASNGWVDLPITIAKDLTVEVAAGKRLNVYYRRASGTSNELENKVHFIITTGNVTLKNLALKSDNRTSGSCVWVRPSAQNSTTVTLENCLMYQSSKYGVRVGSITSLAPNRFGATLNLKNTQSQRCAGAVVFIEGDNCTLNLSDGTNLGTRYGKDNGGIPVTNYNYKPDTSRNANNLTLNIDGCVFDRWSNNCIDLKGRSFVTVRNTLFNNLELKNRAIGIAPAQDGGSCAGSKIDCKDSTFTYGGGYTGSSAIIYIGDVGDYVFDHCAVTNPSGTGDFVATDFNFTGNTPMNITVKNCSGTVRRLGLFNNNYTSVTTYNVSLLNNYRVGSREMVRVNQFTGYTTAATPIKLIAEGNVGVCDDASVGTDRSFFRIKGLAPTSRIANNVLVGAGIFFDVEHTAGLIAHNTCYADAVTTDRAAVRVRNLSGQALTFKNNVFEMGGNLLRSDDLGTTDSAALTAKLGNLTFGTNLVNVTQGKWDVSAAPYAASINYLNTNRENKPALFRAPTATPVIAKNFYFDDEKSGALDLGEDLGVDLAKDIRGWNRPYPVSTKADAGAIESVYYPVELSDFNLD